MERPTENRKVRVEKTSTTTPAQRASAERNRDALTLMSSHDRARYAGQFAVVLRVGPSAGTVMGHGATMEDAVRDAEKQPAYQPMDCSLRYIIPPDEPILAIATHSASEN